MKLLDYWMRNNLLVVAAREVGMPDRTNAFDVHTAKMRELMTGLLYTKTYLSAPVVADPIWHTEYVGRLTVDDPAEEYADVEQRYAEKFSQRDRDIPEDQIRTWLTTHSSVYDVANLKLTVISQEDLEHELTFEL